MHIFFLAHRVPFPADKGEKIRTFHQIKFLVDLGYRITVFAPLELQNEVRFAKALEENLGVKVVTVIQGFAVLRKIKALLIGNAISVCHFHSSSLQLQLNEALAASKPDAVVCTSSVMAAYLYNSARTVKKHVKSQWLMDFMDLDSDKWQQYAKKAVWPLKWIYQREAKLIAKLERQVHRDFDHGFFISDNEVQLFCQTLTEEPKISVLGNGIDTKNFFPADIPKQVTDAPVFLFTGVMNYLPNEDAVLWFVKKMWSAIRQQWPQATFNIVGMQPSSQIQELAKQPGVVVTGYVDDILPYYHQADIFIAPFRLARGVQNKILQAMACGLPVVTTSLGAEGIACQDEQQLLIADNESAFIKAIGRLIQNPALRQKLGENACALIQQQYSWQGVLQHFPRYLRVQGPGNEDST